MVFFRCFRGCARIAWILFNKCSPPSRPLVRYIIIFSCNVGMLCGSLPVLCGKYFWEVRTDIKIFSVIFVY